MIADNVQIRGEGHALYEKVTVIMASTYLQTFKC